MIWHDSAWVRWIHSLHLLRCVVTKCKSGCWGTRDFSTKCALLMQKVYIDQVVANSTKIGHRCLGNDRKMKKIRNLFLGACYRSVPWASLGRMQLWKETEQIEKQRIVNTHRDWLVEKTLACCEGSFVRGRQARRWINRPPNQGNVVCLAKTAFFANHALRSWIWTPIFNWGPMRWEVSLQQSGTAASVCFGLHHAFRILLPDVMNEENKSKAYLPRTWDQTRATARTPCVPSQKDSQWAQSLAPTTVWTTPSLVPDSSTVWKRDYSIKRLHFKTVSRF